MLYDVIQETSSKIGLNIHKGKTKLLKMNSNFERPVVVNNEALEEVDSFRYLGSIVDKLGGTDEDVRIRIKLKLGELPKSVITKSRLL